MSAIRADIEPIRAALGVRVAVTGATAIGIDVADKLDRALLPYLAVVIGLALILLLLVFRSILVPVKATVGFLLSILATFGAVVAIFQWGWLAEPLNIASKGPIVSFLPIFLIGLVFGLAMDYEVFLVTRMREEFVHGASAEQAVVVGFEHGARVVTAAAVIMISVFGGFMLAPEPIIQSIGFALAFGVLVDAFVVRMTLVPAVLSLLGARAWWLPGWLDRILPDVDVEGEKLRARLDAEHAAEPAPSAAEPQRAPSPAVLRPAHHGVPAAPVAAELPAAAVHGTIARADGDMVPAAVVTVIDMDGRQVGRCAAGPAGAYRVALPDAGTYVVLASAPGYRPVVVSRAVHAEPSLHDVVLVPKAAPPVAVPVAGPVAGPDEADEAQGADGAATGRDGSVVGQTGPR